MIASARGVRGSPGARYWLRTGRPVWAPSLGMSMKDRAGGVAMIWTVQPWSCASWTRWPTWPAGPAEHTITYRTRLWLWTVILGPLAGRRIRGGAAVAWAGRS